MHYNCVSLISAVARKCCANFWHTNKSVDRNNVLLNKYILNLNVQVLRHLHLPNFIPTKVKYVQIFKLMPRSFWIVSCILPAHCIGHSGFVICSHCFSDACTRLWNKCRRFDRACGGLGMNLKLTYAPYIYIVSVWSNFDKAKSFTSSANECVVAVGPVIER